MDPHLKRAAAVHHDRDRTADALVRCEMPIEQLIRYAGKRFQLEFANEALSWLPKNDELLANPSYRGLLLQAVNEETLSSAAHLLRVVYGNEIVILSPMVRYIVGKDLLEPIMHVRIDTRRIYACAVRRDVIARSSTILEEELAGDRYLIRATAPLELLLGQSAHLIRVTDEDTSYWSWLSHYAPKRPDGDGGRAA
jgi:hypothetical protein